MHDIEDVLEEALRASEIMDDLNKSTNMCDIGDKIDSLDEKTAKLLLRKYVYAYRRSIKEEEY